MTTTRKCAQSRGKFEKHAFFFGRIFQVVYFVPGENKRREKGAVKYIFFTLSTFIYRIMYKKYIITM
jgi:hypothetical protein